MTLSRADQSLLAQWWFTIDRVLLAAIFITMAAGLVISLAASPSVAVSKGLTAFHFVQRHILFAAIGTVLILVLSLQSPAGIRRFALVVLIGSFAGLVAVQFWGVTANGAQRWLRILGYSLQPSELAKPAFVVLSAWAFAQSQLRKDMPGLPIAIVLFILFGGLLILQPDIGQTLLISIVWGALFVLAGLSIIWVISLGICAAAGIVAAYFALPHVRFRIEQFFSPVQEETSQLARAYRSFIEGGFLGRGPGEGTIKTSLPDAHTDFIFAVIAEEYGVAACLGLLALFAVMVYRALIRAVRERDLSNRFAIAGLALLIGFQALINMGVNVGLLPAKGMTLPMISAGGSSMIGVSVALGMLLGLTRRRADNQDVNLPVFSPTEFGRIDAAQTQMTGQNQE